MDDIEFINNAGFDRWKDIVQLTGDIEGWLLSDNDLHVWKTGFGDENFNLLVAVDRKTNKTIGSVASAYYKSINNSEPLMTVGMFFVAPTHRGKGIGLKLFDILLKDERFDGINWGLNGVPSMTKKYAEKFGFKKYGDWSISCIEIETLDVNLDSLNDSDDSKNDDDIEIISANDINIDKVIEYDYNIQGNVVRRNNIVKSILRSNNSFNKIATNKNNDVIGYGNIRIGFNNQLSVGPLYADNSTIAVKLLKNILNSIENLKSYPKLMIFPPDKNVESMEIIKKLCNNKYIDHGVMYGQSTKHVIKTDYNKIFCVTDYAMAYA